MRFSAGMVWALLCMLLAAAWPARASDAERNAPALTLGIVPYLSTRNLLAIHQPLARSLEASLQQPVQIQTAPDYDTFVKRDRKSTRLNSSHLKLSRMPSSA